MANLSTPFTRAAKVKYPILCGAMYPCSNPELVAAASEAGGLGIVQPISLAYVHGRDLREGLKKIRALTDKPFGFNVLTEQSSKIYLDRMKKWVDISLEEGCRFFVTALGNPQWIVERVKPLGGVVYHDVTERKWALKARDAGVDGLICVNNRAGGHAGSRSPETLIDDLRDLGLPLVLAGGVGTPEGAAAAIRLGYSGVQMGTRFIATPECSAHSDYKQAILDAGSDDVVLTERITGVPVSVIRTASVERLGTRAGPIARRLLQSPRFKHYVRMYYSLKSLRTLKHASLKGLGYQDFWQAGKSVDGIERLESASDIVRSFGETALGALPKSDT